MYLLTSVAIALLPQFSVGVLTVGVLTVGASTVGLLTVGVLPVEAMLLSQIIYRMRQLSFYKWQTNQSSFSAKTNRKIQVVHLLT